MTAQRHSLLAYLNTLLRPHHDERLHRTLLALPDDGGISPYRPIAYVKDQYITGLVVFKNLPAQKVMDLHG